MPPRRPPARPAASRSCSGWAAPACPARASSPRAAPGRSSPTRARCRPAWLRSARRCPGAEILPGGPPAAVPAGVDRIVVSPGVDLRLPVLADARRRAVPVLSDIDLFVAEAAAPITAITGSNGKSTVTSMVGAMLAGAGVRAAVGGNLGTPALELLAPGRPALRAGALQLPARAERAGAHGVCRRAEHHARSPGHPRRHGGLHGREGAHLRPLRPRRRESRPAGAGGARAGGHADRGFRPRRARRADDFGLLERGDGAWLARGSEPLLPVAELQRHRPAQRLERAGRARARHGVAGVRTARPAAGPARLPPAAAPDGAGRPAEWRRPGSTTPRPPTSARPSPASAAWTGRWS